MTRNQKQYGDAYAYQAFMTRAFRTASSSANHTDNGEFRLLEHIENGHYGKRADYPKQVQKIKNYLAKAIAKVLKWKLTDGERSLVNSHAAMVEQAGDGDDLASAINGLLEATQRFKEY